MATASKVMAQKAGLEERSPRVVPVGSRADVSSRAAIVLGGNYTTNGLSGEQLLRKHPARAGQLTDEVGCPGCVPAQSIAGGILGAPSSMEVAMKHRWWLRIRVQRLFMTSAACAVPAGCTSRRLGLAALCTLLLPLAATAQDAQIIYEVRSQYQLITVQDTANGYRQLIFDGRFDGTDAIQSEMNLASPDELTLSYSQHIMAALPVVSRPRRVLVVGLGGACIQRYLHRLLPDATIETAELDPEMRDVAAKYFFFKEDARQIVHLGDGRALIERSKDRYDVILLDAFSATSIPYHLTTREFLQAVKDHLAEGGVVGANLWDGEASYWDQVRTYAAVFPELHVVKCAGSGNSIVLAVPAKTDLTVQAWADKAAAFEKARPTGLDLPQLILRGAAGKTSIPESARVLADKTKSEGSGRISAQPPVGDNSVAAQPEITVR